MILHDYLCKGCGQTFEAFVNPDQHDVACPLCESGTAHRVYMSFGGMLGKSKGRFPYFDVQLGITLESAQHRDRVAKERGLFVMGNDEFRRSRNAPRPVADTAARDRKRHDGDEKLWNDLKYGNVPLPEPPKQPDVESDFLDVAAAPETKG